MTVSVPGQLVFAYSGDGSTQIFSYPVRFLDDEELTVILEGADGVQTVQTLSTHYTVSDAGEANGGSVTMLTAPAAGEKLYIFRDTAAKQTVDLADGQRAPAQSTEDQLDRFAMALQDHAATLARSVKKRVGSDLAGEVELPDPEADKLVGWNASGNALENKTPGNLGVTEIITDTGLAGGSDNNVPSTSAAKAYADTKVAKTATDASTFSFVAGKDATPADTSKVLPTVERVEAYADTKVPMLATKTAAAAYTPLLAPDFLRTAGYTSAGDGGAAIYKKVASEPSHDGKFSITLSDGTTTAWYELAELRPSPEMFGAPKDGTNDDAAAINKAITYANALSLPEVLLVGDYRLNTPIVPKSGVMLIGGKKARLNSHTTAAYNHSSTTLGPLQHAGVQGVAFVHYDDTDANAVAIKLNSCQYCRWSDIYMSGYDAGTAVYINTTLEHTDVPASGIDEPYGAVNFLFNKFDQIVVQACKIGFDFIGGPLGATTFGNVITANEYRGIVLRSVSQYGLNSRQWHDNDRFYDWHITITADGAACVNLGMSASADEYIGVSAHHFYGLTMVRDMTVTWTNCYGIVFRNTPQCLVTVASDGEWPVAGQFLYNPYDVEVDIRGSYLHPTYADGSPVSVFENRVGRISQSTLTEQFGNVVALSGATSYAVTMPAKMFKKPDVVNVMPYSNPGVYWYVDYTTISATGFTIKFSAALSVNVQFNWEAKVRAVS